MCNEDMMLVYEIKGLLEGLSHDVHRAKFNLATDNIGELTNKIADFKMILDKIESRVNEYWDANNEDEDIW